MVQLKLITAVCSPNMGIGKGNDLPWRLKTEMEYFTRMTSSTIDNTKKNVVIMGRRTWDSIPSKFKPLSNRINFVLSRFPLDLSTFKDSYSFNGLNDAIDTLKDNKFKDSIENVWVVGGSHIYKEAIDSKYFYRLYLTEILKEFDCDTFFPEIPVEILKEISDPGVPKGIQEEKGIQFVYKVYENITFKND